MTNNEFLTKETNEIIKAALTGGSFQLLAQSIANQLPPRSTGAYAEFNNITYDEIFCAIYNSNEKAIKG